MKKTLSSKKMIMKEYPYLAFSIKDVKEFIQKIVKAQNVDGMVSVKFIEFEAGEELANHSSRDTLKKGFREVTPFKHINKSKIKKILKPLLTKAKPKKKGLKVIDGTPTAISNYLSEREKKGCGKWWIDDYKVGCKCGIDGLCPACSKKGDGK